VLVAVENYPEMEGLLADKPLLRGVLPFEPFMEAPKLRVMLQGKRGLRALDALAKLVLFVIRKRKELPGCEIIPRFRDRFLALVFFPPGVTVFPEAGPPAAGDTVLNEDASQAVCGRASGPRPSHQPPM
jgi:hypothetical protein